jgi:hypothetical protein
MVREEGIIAGTARHGLHLGLGYDESGGKYGGATTQSVCAGGHSGLLKNRHV